MVKKSSRTILVTGGSGKFGRLIVKHLLDKGDFVITTSSNKNTIEKMMEIYDEYHKNLCIIQSDLTIANASDVLVKKMDSMNLHPSCLINNARNLKYLKIEKNGSVSRKNFSNEFLLDVIVPYELTISLSDSQNSRLKKVVNIGSQYGTVASNLLLYDNYKEESPLHYGVCKAALVHLTKELAVRLARKNIQVNCIAFGGVEGRVNKGFQKRYASLSPIGRMLRDDEIAGPIDLLLSNEFSAMTGHTVAIDGGWTIW